MPSPSSRSRIPSIRSPRAILVSRRLPGRADVDESLSELRALLAGLGIPVVHAVVHRRVADTSPTLLGAGKTREVAEKLAELRGELHDEPMILVFDGELRAGQRRALERELDVDVADRTDIILRVFEQRAQTPIARLEVALAKLAYEVPRARDDDANEGRTGGGGRGGRGHTNVELTKDRIRGRIARLRRELENQRHTYEAQRARRSRVPTVALVGYTNAGKSSLMRALTGSDVRIEDKLFASVGTTVRALAHDASPRVLVADTVGFLRNLPHELVASFRATLDEARDAALRLIVVDASDPAFREQLAVVREALDDAGAGNAASLVVFNKIDRLDDEARAALAREMPAALLVSAHSPSDVVSLRNTVLHAIRRTASEPSGVLTARVHASDASHAAMTKSRER